MVGIPNLDKLTIDELHAMRKELDIAIQSFEARRLADARQKLEETARQLGVTLEEVVGGPANGKSRRKGKSGPIGAVKFRHPEKPSLTWTGRGRRPAWFVEARDAGISEDAMKV